MVHLEMAEVSRTGQIAKSEGASSKERNEIASVGTLSDSQIYFS